MGMQLLEDCGVRGAGCGVQGGDGRMQAAGCGIRGVGRDVECGLGNVGCGWYMAGCELWVARATACMKVWLVGVGGVDIGTR
jgi:hypothetical protein